MTKGVTYEEWVKAERTGNFPERLKGAGNNPHRAHWCLEFEGMLIDDTRPEWESCLCFPKDER